MKKCLNCIFSSAMVAILISVLVFSLKFINIANAEDNLTITMSSQEMIYEQGKPAVVVAPELIISGPENTRINKAQIKVTTNYSKGNDAFVYGSIQGVNIKWNAQNYILFGDETIENYQRALRSIYFKNQGQVQGNEKVIRFTIFTEDGNTASAEKTITIRTVNTAPIIKLSNPNAPLLYTEKEPFKMLDEYLEITDVDNGNIASAIISIYSSFVAGEDFLDFEGQDGIIGNYDEVTGKLFLTGTASVSRYQQVFRSIGYKNTSNNPNTLTRTIKYYIKDDCGAEAIQTKIINIQVINDLPEIIIHPETIHFVEGDTALTIDNSIRINDPDSDNMNSAQVWITEGYEALYDILEFNEIEGISASFDSITGKLDISGHAAKEKYEEFFRGIRFYNSSKNPISEERLIELTVIDDKSGVSLPARKLIAVTPVMSKEEILSKTAIDDFKIEDIAGAGGNGKVKLMWTPVDAAATGAIGYLIFSKKGELDDLNYHSELPINKFDIGEVSTNQYIINNLEPEAIYTFVIYAFDGTTYSEVSERLKKAIKKDEIAEDENVNPKEEDPVDNETPSENDVPSDNTKPSDSVATPVESEKPTINKSKKNRDEVETPPVQMQITGPVDAVLALSYIENNYKDISSCLWAEKEIALVVSMDLIKSETPDNFQPYKSITRAEFVYGIMKLLNLHVQGEISFVDVDKEAYYYKEITSAKSLGIVHGIGDEELGTNEYITRQDMITIAARAARKVNLLKSENAASLVAFEDYESIAQYARESIELLVGEGIIKGGGASLYPNNPTTRAEAAVVFYRIYERFIKLINYGL